MADAEPLIIPNRKNAMDLWIAKAMPGCLKFFIYLKL
jgi:hypothetical protein